LILFLDALDQLGSEDRAHELAWLPITLPAHVRLVLSTLPGQAWTSLVERVPGSARLEVRAMLPSEGAEVLGAWLREAGRDLTPQQHEDVLAKFERSGGLPLYLKLAFEEARRWHSYDDLPAHSDDQPGVGADIPGVLRDLFWRLEQESNHGTIMVTCALGYLAAAKNGLSEDELLDVLWADPAVQADFFRRSPRSPQELTALPVIMWSRLHLDIEAYLAWRQADGTELLGFHHRQLQEAVEARYCGTQQKRAQHQHLAEYFGSPERPFWLDVDRREPDRRKAAELAYQQAYAGLATELHDTLTTFDFLNARLVASGTEDLIGDYDLALVSSPPSHLVAGEEGEGLRLIRDGLRLSAHVLAQDPDQLPCQLLGRLLGIDHSEVRRLLETARAFRHRPWLRPLTPCLTPPGGAELSTLITGHTATSNIHAVAPLPDGKRVLSGSFDGTLKLWDLETGAELRTFIGHQNPIWAVAVLANGKQALAASSDGRLKLWDLETGGCLRTFVGPREPIWDVAVLADGMRALSASADRTLQLWDLRTGAVLRTFVGHTGWVKAVALLAGSRRAISASHDRTLRLWDMETGAELRTFTGHSGEVEAVAVTPDGLRALSASDDHTLRLWDLATGAELRTFSGHDGGVTSVAVLADGRRAISASHDRTLRLWDLETGKELRTFAGHTKGVSALSLLPDGRRAISASSDMTLKLWDLETRFAQPSTGQASRVSAVTVLPDGQRALSATFDHTLKLWSLETGVELSTFTGHTGRVTAAALLADGQRALSASGDHTLRLWDLQTGKCLRTFAGHTGQVSAVVVLADGKRAISASEDHTLKLWDLNTGKELRTFVGHSDWVTAVAVLADGKRAISGSWSGDPMLWDLETGAMLRAFAGRSGGVTAVVVLADGKRALSASPDNSLTVWDLETGVELHTIPMPNKHDFALKLWLVPKIALTGIEHTSQVSAMAVQKDGKRAFSAYWDNTVKLWDLESGIVQQTFTGHTEEVSGVALSADGRRGISVSGDHALKLWDLGTGACVCTFSTDGPLTTCAMADDSHYIAGDSVGRMHFLRLEGNLPAMRPEGGQPIAPPAAPQAEPGRLSRLGRLARLIRPG